MNLGGPQIRSRRGGKEKKNPVMPLMTKYKPTKALPFWKITSLFHVRTKQTNKRNMRKLKIAKKNSRHTGTIHNYASDLVRSI